jgi:hypothetical protein
MWEVVVGPFTSKDEAERWVEIVRRKSKGWTRAKVQQVPRVEVTITEKEDVDRTVVASGERTVN